MSIFAEPEQCRYEFAPSVRCLMVAGHDDPYYPYLDYGQTGEYSTILSRGSAHQVVADPPEVPPRDEWTGQERRDSLPRYPQFKPTPQPSEPHSDAHCAEHVKWRGVCGDIECYCSCHQPSDPS